MRLVDGVVVEAVGRDVMALTPEGEAVCFSGEVADSFRRLITDPQALTRADGEILLRTGLVTETPGSVTRRGVVLGGVAVAGAGVVALSLPQAAAASSQPSDIWGDYSAVENFSGGRDFLRVWIYVAPEAYDQSRDFFSYPLSSGWPAGVDPAEEWTLLFGNDSVRLDAATFDEEPETVRHLQFGAFEDQEDWNERLYDLLAGDWQARRTIELSMTNGTVTLPVSLFAFPWLS